MTGVVVVYGKDACPYTRAAREDLGARGVQFTYFDVKKDAAAMKRFLELSGGDRQVPLIVDAGGRVSVGFGGT